MYGKRQYCSLHRSGSKAKHARSCETTAAETSVSCTIAIYYSLLIILAFWKQILFGWLGFSPTFGNDKVATKQLAAVVDVVIAPHESPEIV